MAYYPYAVETGAHYRLVGPDGSVAVFNVPSDPSYVGMVTNVSGLDSADVRESASDLVEADGGTHGNFYMGRRPVVIDARVFGHQSIFERTVRIDRARRASLALRGDSILTWKPSTRVENMAQNPGAETDLTGIIGNGPSVTAGSTVTRTTAQAQSGSASAQVVTTAAQQGVSFAMTGTFLAGTTYGIGFWVRNTQATTVEWYVMQGAGGGTFYGFNSQNSVGSMALAANVWTRGYFEFTPVANVVNPFLNFRVPTGQPGAQTFFVDNVTARDYIEFYVPLRRNQAFREVGGWVKDLQMPMVSEYSFVFGSEVKTGPVGMPLENRGNIAAWPLVNITGVSVNPTVSDGTRTFRTTGLNLAAGETVQFDMLNHTGVFTAGARNGQSANRYIDWTATQWVDLDGLGSTQTFSLTGGGAATVAYRDTWG